MNRGNGWFVAGTLLVLAIGVAVLLIQRSRNAMLRAEIAAARVESALLEKLRAEAARLREQQIPADALEQMRAIHASLPRLRAKIDALNRASQMQRTAAVEPLAAGMIPIDKLTDAGRASPRAAAESLFRSRNLSDVDALAKSTRLEGEARRKVEEVWNRMPPESRTKYPTPEHLVALLQAAAAPVSGVEIVNESRLGADAVSVGMKLQFPNGRVGTQQFDFKRTEDGWLWSVSPTVVEKMLPLITGFAKQGVGSASK